MEKATFTTPQAAAMLGISLDTFRKWLQHDPYLEPARRESRMRRFTQAEVEALKLKLKRYSTGKLAETLALSRSETTRILSAGRIPCVRRVGRKWMLCLADIERVAACLTGGCATCRTQQACWVLGHSKRASQKSTSTDQLPYV